jgi:hypothetical protein
MGVADECEVEGRKIFKIGILNKIKCVNRRLHKKVLGLANLFEKFSMMHISEQA